MGDIAVRVSGLGKLYQIGAAREKGEGLRHALEGGLRRLFRRGGPRPAPTEDFWALKDVSFEVPRGECVGIIGRNGAGKSTLLKVLSRITEPTTGEIGLRGRVASLLEVGTGFHPELSGRENVYLNGSILGMGRKEIDRKFDEIVAFSEVEKFLDTPVKRYSSGMYVRLAFAVAAHLEPEVLIVDEVLAVGDVEFQRKCLGKMQEVTKDGGRTVLFVSHNMAAVQKLCTRGVVLRRGGVSANDTAERAIAEYLRGLEAASEDRLADLTERRGAGRVRLVELGVSSEGVPAAAVQCGKPVRFEFRVDRPAADLGLIFTIYDQLGLPLATFDSRAVGSQDRVVLPDDTLACEVGELLLLPGRYRLNAAVSAFGELQDHIEGAAVFDVVPSVVGGRAVPAHEPYAKVVLPHQWFSMAEVGALR